MKLSSSVSLHEDDELALSVCTRRIQFVEKVKELSSSSESYSDFYSFILNFDNIDQDNATLYHARLLDSLTKKDIKCGVHKWNTNCSFIHIASGYFSVGDHKTSLAFYEKALANDEMNTFQSISSVKTLYDLYFAYKNYTMVEKIKKKLVEQLFEDARNQPSSVVYSYKVVYLNYLNILDSLGERDKGNSIRETILDAVHELGEKKVDFISLNQLYEIAKTLLYMNEYERVVKFSNYGLQRIQNTSSNVFEFIGFSLWKSKAAYLAGNFSDASKLFPNLIEFLIAENFIRSYSNDYIEVCYYLIQLSIYDYVVDCYLQDTNIYLQNILFAVSYMLFAIPYDSFVINNSTVIVENPPLEKYPPIAKQSKLTNLIFEPSTSLADMHHEHHAIMYFEPFIEFYVRKNFNILLTYNSFRFFVNFSYIFFKLIIAYIFFIFTYNCSKRIISIIVFGIKFICFKGLLFYFYYM